MVTVDFDRNIKKWSSCLEHVTPSYVDHTTFQYLDEALWTTSIIGQNTTDDMWDRMPISGHRTAI